jgi:hypothetical protein
MIHHAHRRSIAIRTERPPAVIRIAATWPVEVGFVLGGVAALFSPVDRETLCRICARKIGGVR